VVEPAGTVLGLPHEHLRDVDAIARLLHPARYERLFCKRLFCERLFGERFFCEELLLGERLPCERLLCERPPCKK